MTEVRHVLRISEQVTERVSERVKRQEKVVGRAAGETLRISTRSRVPCMRSFPSRLLIVACKSNIIALRNN